MLVAIKTNLLSRNENKAQQNSGLAYGNATVGDLVNKDTDGDGIPDWQETLWGTDPNKKETTPGISDSVVIAKLKSQQQINGQNSDVNSDANLTQTDKFSREFLATVTTLNQSGTLDQATQDQIGNSLAEKIKNSPVRKIYTLVDIKIGTSDTPVSIKKYSDALSSLSPKTSFKYGPIDVLKKFEGDGNNVNVDALSELTPIIKQTNTFIAGMLKINTPSTLAALHLEVINALERVQENLSDIRSYDTDVIVALRGITNYETNQSLLDSAVSNLDIMINRKLNN